MEQLIHNLFYHLWLTIFFLLGWPITVTVVVRIWGLKKDNVQFNFLGALYYSVATYFGMSDQEENPERYKWLKLIHRFIGILAWAYITAIFITTIT